MAGLVDVGDDDVRAFLEQVLHQVVADLADACYADSLARAASGAPHAVSAAARMPWIDAERGQHAESPAPPCSTVRPVTKSHSRAMTSMSSL